MEGFRSGKIPNEAGQVLSPSEAPFESCSIIDGIIEAKKEAEKQAKNKAIKAWNRRVNNETN